MLKLISIGMPSSYDQIRKQSSNTVGIWMQNMFDIHIVNSCSGIQMVWRLNTWPKTIGIPKNYLLDIQMNPVFGRSVIRSRLYNSQKCKIWRNQFLKESVSWWLPKMQQFKLYKILTISKFFQLKLCIYFLLYNIFQCMPIIVMQVFSIPRDIVKLNRIVVKI